MRYTVFLSLLFITLSSLSAKNKLMRCEGTYAYTYPKTMSYEEATVRGLKYAIEQAIADKIGRSVKSAEYIEMADSKESFNKIAQISVKGEWVEDIEAPQFSEPIYADNQFTIYVTVAFMARKLEAARVPITVHILRNGMDDRFEADEFKDGDQLYISFTAPSKGYVAIYLEDMENTVCAVPYIGQDDLPFKVDKGVRYLFLNEDNNRYRLSCGAEPEINTVHIVFSTTPFIKGNLVRERSKNAFRKWLGTAKSYDEEDMQVLSFHLRVCPTSSD